MSFARNTHAGGRYDHFVRLVAQDNLTGNRLVEPSGHWRMAGSKRGLARHHHPRRYGSGPLGRWVRAAGGPSGPRIVRPTRASCTPFPAPRDRSRDRVPVRVSDVRPDLGSRAPLLHHLLECAHATRALLALVILSRLFLLLGAPLTLPLLPFLPLPLDRLTCRNETHDECVEAVVDPLLLAVGPDAADAERAVLNAERVLSEMSSRRGCGGGGLRGVFEGRESSRPAGGASGRVSVKCEPTPARLDATRSPFMPRARWRLMDSPRPEPCCGRDSLRSSCTKGSKIASS